MSFSPNVYVVPAFLSFGGAMLVGANSLFSIWGQTEPYWDTDCSSASGYLLIAGLIVLSAAFIADRYIAVSESEKMGSVAPVVKSNRHLIHLVAAGLIVLSAALALRVSCVDDIGYSDNPGEMRGARALQGIVLSLAVLFCFWQRFRVDYPMVAFSDVINKNAENNNNGNKHKYSKQA